MNPQQLPDGAAQQAHNVDVTGGVLAPLKIRDPFNVMHDDNGLMKSSIPAGNVKSIAKPDAPTVNLIEKMAHPEQWLRIWAYDWVSWVDQNGVRQISMARQDLLPIINTFYSETSIFITCLIFSRTYFFERGGPYFLKGPRYQIGFDGGLVNGPEFNGSFPQGPSASDPEFPSQRLSLIDENSNIYAYFQIVDVQGPRYDEDIFVKDFDLITWTVPDIFASYVTFEVNMNYVINKRRHLFYIQSMITSDEEEGPPSELSERIVVKPGEVLTLNTPHSSGFIKNRLYRSPTGFDDFRLVDDINTTVFKDLKPQLKVDTIPPYGNPPNISDTGFLEGNFLHPALFGVGASDKAIHLSDPERFWSWPKENEYPFPEGIDAYALSGNSVLVWSKDLVYAIAGSNPGAMSLYTISKTTPLLNKQSLCQIGQTIFFATTDGLAAASSSGVQIITNNHFTRKEWQFLNPSEMVAKTADNTIFLETTTSSLPTNVFNLTMRPGDPFGAPDTKVNIRIDLDEDIKFVTTYSDLTGGTEFQWLSKLFHFDQETVFEYVRVVAKADVYPVTVKMFADGVEVASVAVPNVQPFRVGGLAHSHDWEFEFRGTGIVREVQVFEKIVETVGDSIRLGPDNTELFHNVHVKFPDADRFVAGILSAQTNSDVPIDFFLDGATEPAYTAVVTNGKPFLLPRTLPTATFVRISANTNRHIDELLLTRRVAANASDVVREVNDGGMAPWLSRRYEFEGRTELKSLVVHAKGAVTMNLYADEATTASTTVPIPNGEEIRLTLGPLSSLEFDFAGNDTDVEEVIVYSIGAVPTVPQGGLALNNPPSWRRNLFQFPDRGGFGCASVSSSDYTALLMVLYLDGSLVHTEIIADGKAFLLPRTLGEGSRWEVDIHSAGEIHSALLMPKITKAVDGPIRVVNPKTIPPWFYTRYVFGEQTTAVSVLIDSDDSVSMRIYLDGKTTTSKIVTVSPGVETLLDVVSARSIEFEFSGEDHEVREVTIFPRVEAPVGDGITLTDRRNWRMLRYKFPDKGSFACVSLGSNDYANTTLTLHADGLIQPAQTILNGNAIALPRTLPQGSQWDVDVVSDGEISNLVLLQRRAVSAGAQIREVNTSIIPRWLHSRYEFEGPTRLRSVRVQADTYPVTMNIYCDGVQGPTKIVIVTDGAEIRLDMPVLCESVEFDFAGSDSSVRDVSLYSPETAGVGDGGVTLQGRANWRDLPFRFVDSGSFAVASLGASSYPATLKLYADGVLVHTETVNDGEVFSLPRTLPEAALWELDVASNAEVTGLFLFPRTRLSIENNTIRLVRNETGPSPWLRARYEFTEKMEIKSAIVIADSYPITMNLYKDGATTATESIVILDADEVRITGMGLSSSVDVDFGGNDGKVTEGFVFAKTPRLLGDTGIALNGAVSMRGNLYKFADKGAFACGSIGAGTYPVTLRLYADGVLVRTQSVADGAVFTLPKNLAEAALWEVDVEGTDVTSVVMRPWVQLEVEGSSLRLAGSATGIPAWLFTRYAFKEWVTLRSIRVLGNVFPVTTDLYRGEINALDRMSIVNLRETKVSIGRYLLLRVDFNDKNNDVREAFLFGQEHVPASSGGFVVRNGGFGSPWRNKTLRYEETGSFSVGRVVATDYTEMKLTLRANGVDQVTVDIVDNGEFKFPLTLINARDWELDIEHVGEIHEVTLISRQVSQVDKNLVVVRADTDPFSWIGRRVIASRPIGWSCGRIVADSYPVTLKLFSGKILQLERLVHDAKAFRLEILRPEREWVFDVVRDDGVAVTEVALSTSMGRLG